MAEYINKQVLNSIRIPAAHYARGDYNRAYRKGCEDMLALVKSIPPADVVELPKGDIGELSDGYHTFNSLYEQRKILTAALVKAHRDISWKSKLHEDGELPFGGGWFIVGLSTPEGEFTYHYELKDWDLFDCAEIPRGKRWDGHTDKDVKRLLSIPAADVRENVKGEWIKCNYLVDNVYLLDENEFYRCNKCHQKQRKAHNYCSNCGADMRKTCDGDRERGVEL